MATGARKTLGQTRREDAHQRRAVVAAATFEIKVVRALEPHTPTVQYVDGSPRQLTSIQRTVLARHWLDSALKRPWIRSVVHEDGPAGRITPQAVAGMVLDAIYGPMKGPHPRELARQAREAVAARRGEMRRRSNGRFTR